MKHNILSDPFYEKTTNYTWHDTGNADSGGRYWFVEPAETGGVVPHINITTETVPVFHEEFSIMSEDDEKSEIVYNYLVEREVTTGFSIESMRIELLRDISLQKGELLSILVQMVSDGVLKFDRRTALYTLNQ